MARIYASSMHAVAARVACLIGIMALMVNCPPRRDRLNPSLVTPSVGKHNGAITPSGTKSPVALGGDVSDPMPTFVFRNDELHHEAGYNVISYLKRYERVAMASPTLIVLAAPPSTVKLIRTYLLLMCCVLVGLVAFGAASAIGTLADHSKNAEKNSHSLKAQQFWAAVAGSNHNGVSAGSKFAEDISQLSGSEIDTFRGDSNKYGGVTEDIGFDPFNESGLNCFECGPLNASVKSNLALVQQGQLRVVVDGLKVQADSGFHVTPFNWTVYGTFIFLWMVVSPLVMLAAHYVSGPDEPWTGGRETLILIALAPTLYFPIVLHAYYKQRAFEKKVRSTFPDHMEVIDEVDEALDRIDPQSSLFSEMKDERNTLKARLVEQTKHGADPHDPVNRYLLESLHSAKENIDLRAKAMEDME